MKSEKFSPEFKNTLSSLRGKKKIQAIVKTKSEKPKAQEIKALMQRFQHEQMATRRAHMLEDIQQYFGKGDQFKENFKDSCMAELAKVKKNVSDGNELWLANALFVEGEKKEIEALSDDDNVLEIVANPSFDLPEVHQTPLEDSPQAIDGNAWGIHKIKAPEVWGGYGKGNDVLIGHLDTGVDGTHPALSGKIQDFESFAADGSPEGAGAPFDDGAHGTHTAGTLVGRRFQGTNLGVAPDAKLLSALVLKNGSGTFAQILGGMQWAIDNGAHVINMSLGANGYFNIWNTPIFNALFANVHVVASIGNSGHITSGGPGNDLAAIGVGATHYEDVVGGFSGGQTIINESHDILGPLGPYRKPDISAPGVQVISSVPNLGVASFSGTSMAAPHVAGAIALMLSTEPILKNEPFSVRDILFFAGTEDLGEQGKDQRYGFGRLDALSAVKAAVSLIS